jgi:hypothetical protein
MAKRASAYFPRKGDGADDEGGEDRAEIGLVALRLVMLHRDALLGDTGLDEKLHIRCDRRADRADQ